MRFSPNYYALHPSMREKVTIIHKLDVDFSFPSWYNRMYYNFYRYAITGFFSAARSGERKDIDTYAKIYRKSGTTDAAGDPHARDGGVPLRADSF